MIEDKLELSDFQRKLLQIPEQFDPFLGGGRGGAKSFSLALLGLRHCEQYGERARVLYLRQTYRGLADFELITRDLFAAAYGTDARFNASEPDVPGLYVVQLIVDDDSVESVPDTFTVSIVDSAPPADAGPDQTRPSRRASL